MSPYPTDHEEDRESFDNGGHPYLIEPENTNEELNLMEEEIR